MNGADGGAFAEDADDRVWDGDGFLEEGGGGGGADRAVGGIESRGLVCDSVGEVEEGFSAIEVEVGAGGRIVALGVLAPSLSLSINSMSGPEPSIVLSPVAIPLPSNSFRLSLNNVFEILASSISSLLRPISYPSRSE